MELGFVHCIYRLLFPAKLVTALAKPSGHEHHQDNNVMRIGNAGKIVRLSGFPGSPSSLAVTVRRPFQTLFKIKVESVL